MSEQTGPYYVVANTYIGPNPDSRGTHARGNRDHYIITTEPPRTNQSHEVRTDGWLGSYNDVSSDACGEYETLEEARESLPDVRENWERSGVPDYKEDAAVLEVWVETEEARGRLATVNWDGEDPDGGLDYPAVDLRENVVWIYAEDNGGGTDADEAWASAAEAINVDPDNRDERERIMAHLDALGWETEEASYGDFWFAFGRPPAEKVELGDTEPQFAGTATLKDRCPHCGQVTEAVVELDSYDQQTSEPRCTHCQGVLWVLVKVWWYASEDDRDNA